MRGGICCRCGATDNLHFHHRDPDSKEFTVGRDFSYAWEKIVEEALKCDLLCERCHKQEHKGDHGGTMYARYKCRCDVCREGWNETMRRYRAKRKANVTAASPV